MGYIPLGEQEIILLFYVFDIVQHFLVPDLLLCCPPLTGVFWCVAVCRESRALTAPSCSNHMFCKGIFSLPPTLLSRKGPTEHVTAPAAFPSLHIKAIDEHTTLILWTENRQSSDAEPNSVCALLSQEPKIWDEAAGQRCNHRSRPGPRCSVPLFVGLHCNVCTSLPPSLLSQELRLHTSEWSFVLLAWNGCGGNGWRSAAWWINGVSQQLVGALITVCLF